MSNKTSSAQSGLNGEISLVGLLFNVLVPSLIMIKGSDVFPLSPCSMLMLALAFPMGYGIYQFVLLRQFSFLSIFGFCSLLLTGGIGLLRLPKEWLAIKEALLPFLLGIFVLVSLKTNQPLIKIIFYHEKVMCITAIESRLQEACQRDKLSKLFKKCSFLFVISLWLSASLDYALVKILVRGETGTEAFNSELGQATFWAYPIVVIPCALITTISLWTLVLGIKKLTKLSVDEILDVSNAEAKK